MGDARDSRFRQGAWPYGLILASALILASNHIVGRYVQDDLPPMGIGFWRVALATAVLLPFVGSSVWAKRRALVRHWSLFLVLAIALGPFGNASVYLAYHFTTAINGGVVATAQPVAVAIIMFLVFREAISWAQGLGIATATLGVFVILSRGDPAALAGLQPNAGDLIMLVAMFGFAVHNCFLRRIPGDFTTAEILLSVQCFSMLVMLPIYVAETMVFKPMPVTWEAAAVIGWVGIGVAIVAVGFTNTAVLAIGANKAAMANYLRALFTAALAVIILGERPELFHLAAFALIVAGVLLMGQGRRAR